MLSLHPESMIGTRIGQFRVDEFIAKGAMGLVFKGFDSVLERMVALKLMPKADDSLLPGEEEARKRFTQEAKATARLSDHPNIVTIYSTGETDSFQYICMEYVHGKSLAQILRAEKRLPPLKAVPLFEQILLGIQAAFEAGITHRDIKPSNIMVDDEGWVRVVDFGVAKVASLAMTTTGAVLGTPYYMSPEQITGNKVDSRSDIYSIGAVLYQALTGERPFEGESTSSLLYKIVNTQPIQPDAIDADIPVPLCDIIRKAMEKSPVDRYQAPSEMLRALRDVKKHLERNDRANHGATDHPTPAADSHPTTAREPDRGTIGVRQDVPSPGIEPVSDSRRRAEPSPPVAEVPAEEEQEAQGSRTGVYSGEIFRDAAVFPPDARGSRRCRGGGAFLPLAPSAGGYRRPRRIAGSRCRTLRANLRSRRTPPVPPVP